MTKQEKEFLIQLTETISIIQDCLLKVGKRLKKDKQIFFKLENRVDKIEKGQR